MSGFTLDGKFVDDKLPEGWGQRQSRVGRVGDWSRDQVSQLGRLDHVADASRRETRPSATVKVPSSTLEASAGKLVRAP